MLFEDFRSCTVDLFPEAASLISSRSKEDFQCLRWVVTCGYLLRPCTFPVRSGFGLVAGDVQRTVMAYHQCLHLLIRILKGDTGERARGCKMRVRSI